MSKLIIIASELPVEILRDEKKNLIFQERQVLFGTSLAKFYQERKSIWIGSPGLDKGDLTKHERSEAIEKLKEWNCHPIFIRRKEREKYLDGFCNRTIWPLFHYFTQNAIYSADQWDSYVRINEEFADFAIQHMENGDKIWIHDYHLMLLPQLIRQSNPDVSIGFFLHITFPSYEIFRLIPWRKEILEGLLGADLIGFHTYDYERHFMSCVRRLLGFDSVLNRIHLEERIVQIDFFPLGIDYDTFSKSAGQLKKARTSSLIEKGLLNQNLIGEGKKLILSIDRLDYTKGIPVRLKAYEKFLEVNPQYHQFISLLLFVMPSRESVEQYKILKRELDELVGRINSRFGSINWMPIWYFYRHMQIEELAELSIASDIGLITPIRDGMNLIAKLFVASKPGKPGVLILSEMAGASKEMSEALIVNPNNMLEISNAIKEAIEMPVGEQIQRNELLQKRLSRYNEVKWATDFINSLDRVKKIQEIKLARKITTSLTEKIKSRYSKAKKRLMFLDYDGTLMGFDKDPQKVSPDNELISILKDLTDNPLNRVIIISGRDKETLGKWFPPPWNIGFIAEHGVWSKEPDTEWIMMETIDKNWMEIIKPTLEFYVDRTPRSFIEQKNYSLVWHYRNADVDLGEIRSWELKDELKNLVNNLNLEIMDGDKVIEIKNSGINKGRAAMMKIGEISYDFIMAVGDDWTDEYTFGALPENAITIKVGTKTTKADYYLESVEDVRELLKGLNRK